MFKTRLLSAIALVIIIAFVLVAGGPVLFIFTLLVALKAFFEMTKATKVSAGDLQVKKPFEQERGQRSVCWKFLAP